MKNLLINVIALRALTVKNLCLFNVNLYSVLVKVGLYVQAVPSQ